MTADTTEVAKELRERALEMHAAAWSRPDGGQECTIGASLCDAAADEIERLTAENERMRADLDQGAKDYCDLMEHRGRQHVQIAKLEAALRPFVKYVHDDLRRGSATYELVAVDRHGGGLIGAEDLRRARAALPEGGPDGR